MVLATQKPLEVRLTKFSPKLNTEGKKLITINLEMAETKDSVKGPLAEAVACMKANDSLDDVQCTEEMQSVRLAFASPATPTLFQQEFEITNLFDFSVSREKTTQAGTLNAEESGRIMVDFRFTVPLTKGGKWACNEYSNDLIMTIEKAQGELSLQDQSPDSQEARNEHIAEGEKADEGKKGKKAKKS
jgi:hypothetical protein